MPLSLTCKTLCTARSRMIVNCFLLCSGVEWPPTRVYTFKVHWIFQLFSSNLMEIGESFRSWGLVFPPREWLAKLQIMLMLVFQRKLITLWRSVQFLWCRKLDTTLFLMCLCAYHDSCSWVDMIRMAMWKPILASNSPLVSVVPLPWTPRWHKLKKLCTRRWCKPCPPFSTADLSERNINGFAF